MSLTFHSQQGKHTTISTGSHTCSSMADKPLGHYNWVSSAKTIVIRKHKTTAYIVDISHSFKVTNLVTADSG